MIQQHTEPNPKPGKHAGLHYYLKENKHTMNDKLTLPKWEIIYGDALSLLRSYPAGSFDAIITDPPYASGGRTQAEKNKSTAQKYSSMGENAPPAFDGDAKDQRSFTSWCAEWLSECRRIAKPGAPLCVFIPFDFRRRDY